MPTEALLRQLSERLTAAQNQIELTAGRYETLLPPSATGDLMQYLVWTMGGRGAHEGRNAFAGPGGTRIGERLTDLPVTVYSDPSYPGLESSPFVATPISRESLSVFDNGVGIERVDWVRDGVINALSYSRADAAEFGAAPTVGADNLVMTGGGSQTLEQMIAATENGLLLTTLWYIREVDPTTLLLTGLTRDGVYLVRDGQITGAVNNYRFNESPIDLLRRVSQGAPPSTRCRVSGATTPPARPCRRCGSRISTCRRSARRSKGGREGSPQNLHKRLQPSPQPSNNLFMCPASEESWSLTTNPRSVRPFPRGCAPRGMR
ncbi:Zn-dependent protease-like protein [Mycobacteroides abscessus]|nr:Zn-dependent protease-like protein [Mycobacteroides abscessus]